MPSPRHWSSCSIFGSFGHSYPEDIVTIAPKVVATAELGIVAIVLADAAVAGDEPVAVVATL